MNRGEMNEKGGKLVVLRSVVVECAEMGGWMMVGKCG